MTFRSATKLDAVDDTAMNNSVRGLSGKLGTVQTLSLAHTGGAFRIWIQRMRSYVMIIKACRNALQKRVAAAPAVELEPSSEIESIFVTWHASSSLVLGPDSKLPVRIGIIDVYGEFAGLGNARTTCFGRPPVFKFVRDHRPHAHAVRTDQD